MSQLRPFISPFSWRMAFRDAKPQWKSLLLYVSSVIAGVAALVAILSFRSDLLLTIDRQALELLGSDLEIRSSQPFPEEILAFSDSLQSLGVGTAGYGATSRLDATSGSDANPGSDATSGLDVTSSQSATSVEFSSMAYFPSANESRLAQVRAFEGTWPIYGDLETFPPEAAITYQSDPSAIVESSLLDQLGLAPGDSVLIGTTMLPISAALISVPGESEVFSFLGPRIFIPQEIVRGSPLLQRGSRVTYKQFFTLPETANIDQIIADLRPLAREHRVRFDTVESRKEDFREVADNLSRFLGLIGFIALLLGSLGVAGSFFVYMKKKIPAIATLRCLGMEASTLFAIFLIQVLMMGLAGSVIGALIGIAIQQFFPLLLASFLPFGIVQSVSLPSIALGVLTGTGISTLFSLLPLFSASQTSPMRTLRSADTSDTSNLPKSVKFTYGALITPLLLVLVANLTGSWLASLIFVFTLFVSVAALWITARLLMRAVKTLRLRSMPYVWRQGLANLFRPNNQTALLLVAIGMGMLLIGTLYLSQDMLLGQITTQTDEELPDLVLFDVQPDQNEDLLRRIDENGGRILANVPIVTMRLSEINGISMAEILADSSRSIERWVLNREYRVTYRDSLTESETILEGEWIAEVDGFSEVVPISVSDDITEELQVGLQDSLLFNVQGVPILTRIASIRKVNFQRPEPNFFVLFPAGVLEPAPQFFATTLVTSSREKTASLQNEITKSFPNVSALDTRIALDSVRSFLDKIAAAIQFMSFFSIFTGFFVLISSIAMTQRQRVRESVLLRTLGGNKRQVSSILSVEYLLLGSLAVLTGLLLSGLISWGLAVFYFDITFTPAFGPLLGISLGIILLSLAIGRAASRTIFRHAPNEILRMQNG